MASPNFKEIIMDIFNPDHYIPRLYKDEPSKGKCKNNIYDYMMSLNQTKPYGMNVVLATNNQSFVHNAFTLTLNTKLHLHNAHKAFTFIADEKGTFKTKFLIEGDCTIILDSYIVTQQLIYHYIDFKVLPNSKLNLFIYCKESEQKLKNNIDIQLEDNAQIEINCLSLVGQQQYQDDSIAVTHGKDSSSVINYRSFSNGFTVSQVNSIIPAQSQGAKTEQHLKHTMMSEGAKIFSKPNLEILNPNVVAGHGNSIGSISDDELHYLAFRGINEQRANLLIVENETQNFVLKILDTLQNHKEMT